MLRITTKCGVLDHYLLIRSSSEIFNILINIPWLRKLVQVPEVVRVQQLGLLGLQLERGQQLAREQRLERVKQSSLPKVGEALSMSHSEWVPGLPLGQALAR